MPGVDLDAYKTTLIERFSNPEVRDTHRAAVRRELGPHPEVAAAGGARSSSRTGGAIAHSAAIVASWARYAEGIDEQGQPIEVVDRLADRLTESARASARIPDAFIANRDVFGDLADDPRFAAAYRSALSSLHERGARATLEFDGQRGDERLMAQIQFKGVTKRYPDGTEAVKAIDLEIGDGEFMIFVGPSGCGKSTALRMIAGLEEISEVSC